MTEPLEDRLSVLRDDALHWPPTPDVAAAVASRLGAQAAPRWWVRLSRGRLLALGVVLVGGLAASPARTEVLDALGVSGGEEIVRRATPVPTPPTGEPPAFAPGGRTTLAAARRAAGFRVRVPAVLGVPEEVRFSAAIPGGMVTLVYRAPDVVLTQFRGGATPFVRKTVGPGTRVRRTAVGGAPAAFLSGAPSAVVVQDATGRVLLGTATLSRGNVLVWDAGTVAHRLELRGGRARALEIARSLR